VSPDASRERVLAGTYQCVARVGIGKTTVEDVARASGVSRATVYRLFPGGRDELLRDTVAWEMARFFARLGEELGEAPDFETFLKTLLRHRSRDTRMVLVLDNARYHHAVLLKPLLRKYRAVLTLLFLPPYSPQLAPVERVWKLARRMATHNRFFATLDDVLTAVSTCFDRWRTPNSVLRRLCGII